MKPTTFIQTALLLTLTSTTPLARRACTANPKPAVAAPAAKPVTAAKPAVAPAEYAEHVPVPTAVAATAPPPVPKPAKQVPTAPADFNWGGAPAENAAPANSITLDVGGTSSTFSTGRSAMSGGKAMIASINAYRERAGLPPQQWDERLAQNAANTGALTGGTSMKHKMHDGTYGQVLVMGVDDADTCGKDYGNMTPFEVHYYSWLCEVPQDPALGAGMCDDVLGKSHIHPGGQTGHWQLLHAAHYKKIGCAFTRNDGARKCGSHTGVWACDVAF